ncbi:hypothetical protein K443DRAFT_124052 [Laccaria amethystina LaAM-08-1]|uniref:Uncharacterized protein n=1 Tax=Laccaria amethystina LaAM-08-1 TaxID=1095629 RepID=A0A0C9X850_9AGAR|nr:hypothetical protein K443DRAFT_124052 [Laccaria amethystina LaAM-08-1]
MYASLTLSSKCMGLCRMHVDYRTLKATVATKNCCNRVNKTSLGSLGLLTIPLVIHHFRLTLTFMHMFEAAETPPRQEFGVRHVDLAVMYAVSNPKREVGVAQCGEDAFWHLNSILGDQEAGIIRKGPVDSVVTLSL